MNKLDRTKGRFLYDVHDFVPYQFIIWSLTGNQCIERIICVVRVPPAAFWQYELMLFGVLYTQKVFCAL